MKYVCSNCGKECYYDGRCGDGPVLFCDCTKNSYWVNDRCGGYITYKNDAHPIPVDEYLKLKSK